ncbi:hypothetical protein [Saccharothrix hoggarensis]|uniref:DUF3592 domain-containing protein n=1 Tax=Saccharothrix hoggarensis TaxID=913853 RepID=A0ABW3QRR8_9PSEU
MSRRAFAGWLVFAVCSVPLVVAAMAGAAQLATRAVPSGVLARVLPPVVGLGLWWVLKVVLYADANHLRPGGRAESLRFYAGAVMLVAVVAAVPVVEGWAFRPVGAKHTCTVDEVVFADTTTGGGPGGEPTTTRRYTATLSCDDGRPDRLTYTRLTPHADPPVRAGDRLVVAYDPRGVLDSSVDGRRHSPWWTWVAGLAGGLAVLLHGALVLAAWRARGEDGHTLDVDARSR